MECNRHNSFLQRSCSLYSDIVQVPETSRVQLLDVFLHLNTARDYWHSTFVCSVHEVSMYLIRNWFRLLGRITKNTFLSTFNNNIVQKSFKPDESSEWSTLWQWGNSLPKGDGSSSTQPWVASKDLASASHSSWAVQLSLQDEFILSPWVAVHFVEVAFSLPPLGQSLEVFFCKFDPLLCPCPSVFFAGQVSVRSLYDPSSYLASLLG